MRGIRKWMAMGLATVMAGVMLTGTAVFADEANADVSGEVLSGAVLDERKRRGGEGQTPT